MQFVCDYCQAAVKARDKTCPVCNATFSNVRCQQCGYSGEPKEFFKNGCPSCGHDDVVLNETKRQTSWQAFFRPQGSAYYRLNIAMFLVLLINVILFLYAGFR